MPQYLCIKDELCALGDLILSGTRLVIPSSLREKVLDLAHESHQGIVKTENRLRTKVWWRKIDMEAEKSCKACHACQVVGERGPPELMQWVKPPSGPWQDIEIDLMGHFLEGKLASYCRLLQPILRSGRNEINYS